MSTKNLVFALIVIAGVDPCSTNAEKLDYSNNPVKVIDPAWTVSWAGEPASLVDGVGAEPYPIAGNGWGRPDVPRPGKSAEAIFDYQKPVKVTALVHYFYVPGCRDMKWIEMDAFRAADDPKLNDWLSGPSAYKEVKIYTSDDPTADGWRLAAHLDNLSSGCPQVLRINEPVAARYLKLEVISLVEGAGSLRSSEIETWVNDSPRAEDLPKGEVGKAVPFGYPAKAVKNKASGKLVGKLSRATSEQISYTLPAEGLIQPLSGAITATIDEQPVVWQSVANGVATGVAAGGQLTMNSQYVEAGLLLTFDWKGRTNPRFPRLEVAAGLNGHVGEWQLPTVYYSKGTAPNKPVWTSTAGLMNVVSIIGDGRRTLGLIPGTDQSWLGLRDNAVQAAFPLRGQTNQVLLVAARGDCIQVYRKAITDVLDFDEPRQSLPVTTIIEQSCHFLMSDGMWSEKYQMTRFFPGQDVFFVFYGSPYTVESLSYWEVLSDDPQVRERVDKVLRFILARQIPKGAMKGAMFSQYGDRLHLELTGGASQIPYYLPDETLVGMDQSSNRWITSHTMGSVLWSVTQIWKLRGKVPEDVEDGARNVADWMVSHMNEDGSWPYAWYADGRIASPQSDSGTIWNAWALWRYGKLTGEKKYSEVAGKAISYFKRTFTAPKLYRGYWEDHYGGGKTNLDTGQGYEAAIAARAFAEMQDYDAMYSSALDVMMFICTRTMESRTYSTSYGHASENVTFGPGTYIVGALGRAAQLCYQQSGDDFYRRFAGIVKSSGWWQDEKVGAAFWFAEAFCPTPIEMYKEKGLGRQYWAWWDSAQKVAYGIPWMVDLVKEMSGGKVALNVENLRGTNDQGTPVVMSLFKGKISSTSGQVNWMGLRTLDGVGGEQLLLINHAERTSVKITLPVATTQVTAGVIDNQGKKEAIEVETKEGNLILQLPERSLAVVDWR